MIDIRVRLDDRSYPVRIGPWRDWDLRTIVRGWAASPWALVADRRAWETWSEDLLACLGAAGVDVQVLELSGGEPAKTHETLLRIYDHLLAARIRRDGTLAAFGGGVIGDVAGFAAATWQRGIRLVQIPSTLLAQVDSGVGGKTGLNYREHKNFVGVFHQPAAVLISPEWLNSLPAREFRSGLAEVVKCGIIRDAGLLDILEEVDPGRLGRSPRLEEVVARALIVKSGIVEEDERDHGLRRLLNFGHTVGHALESATGFQRFLHGEAVALGIVAAIRLSVLTVGLPEREAQRAESLLERYGLPVRTSGVDLDAILGFVERDKKAEFDAAAWVLTARLGTATVAARVSMEAVRSAVSHVLERSVKP